MPNISERSLKRQFKVGDRVKYTSGYYEESKYNPLWGGVYGKQLGKIIGVRNGLSFEHRYRVEWGVGITNSYNSDDLELAGSINCPDIVVRW